MDSFIIVDMYIFIVIAFLWTPLMKDQILRYVVYKPYLLLLLLLLMCSSSRFPESIPLRNIKAQKIISHLVKLFTFVGLPKAIQSDLGSNFHSNIKQVLKELGIIHYT